jgi:putative aldouronate transport system permease protein
MNANIEQFKTHIKNKEEKKPSKFQLFDTVNYTLMILFAFITIYPFFFVLIGSLNDGQDYASGGIWLFPHLFTTASYNVVLSDARFWLAVRNTVIRTVIATVVSVLFTSMVAYGMSRPDLKHKNVFYWINLITLFFSGGLIPYFLLIVAIGLYDTFWVYIIPAMYSVYNMIVFSSFFRGIPDSIRESAIIDGANEFTIWFRMYLPLSKPVIATVGLWVAVGHWNSYMATMLYTMDTNLITLQYYLMKLIKEANVSYEGVSWDIRDQVTAQTISYAAMIVATIPIISVYPFIQRFFAKGIMIGSLKG